MINKQKIIVAGGGTAGLITALILNKRLNVDITVLAPKDIGIIGVGEGSTEHWSEFLSFIGVSKSQALIETEGTIKSGIFFEGWTPDRGDYFHSLTGDSLRKLAGISYLYLKEFADGISNYDLSPPELWKNKIGDFYNEENNRKETGGYFQFHFNTHKLNEFLQKLCKENNINIIDDKITDVNLNNDGIEAIDTEKGGRLTADWFIDSTGFSKVLIGKLGAKWLSYKDYLPLKEAIAFPTEDQISNYNIWTKSKAMNAGWMWTIPVWGRTGNGYIYDTNFITKEQAHEEVNKLFGKEIEIAKHIKFNPGRLDKSWIKNCIAVGLSANFLEPLEATSIGTSIQSAFILMNRLTKNVSERDKEEYNKLIEELVTNTKDFVALHYINDNRSSDFWKMCSELPRPDILKEFINIWETRPLDDLDISKYYNSYRLFNDDNFNQVAYCHGIFSKETAKTYDGFLNDNVKNEFYNYYKNFNLNMRKKPDDHNIGFIKHKDYIRQLRDNNGDYSKIIYSESCNNIDN